MNIEPLMGIHDILWFLIHKEKAGFKYEDDKSYKVGLLNFLLPNFLEYTIKVKF